MQPTAKQRQTMREQMKTAWAASANFSGTSTETHVKIDTSDLKQSEFEFTPPANVMRNDWLLGAPLAPK